MLLFHRFSFITIILLNYGVLSKTLLSSIPTICRGQPYSHIVREGEIIELRGKFYKMESCSLHRAYHACGTYLLQMVSVACNSFSNGKETDIQQKRLRRFSQRKLLTEACCDTFCTIAEMTRYCP